MSAKKQARPPAPPPSPETGRLRRLEALVEPGGAERADRYIAERLGVLSRSQLKARGARLFVGGKAAKFSRPLLEGESLLLEWTEEDSPGLEPERIELSLLYEDGRVLVVDKAQGMVTHPGAGNRRGTLANAVLGRLAAEGLGDEGGGPALRGGIVHRLDKDTSGVIIVAKDAEAQAFLAAQFKDRSTRKDYLAVVAELPRGAWDGGGWQRIENRLGRDRRDRKRFAEVEEGGRPALTEWRLLARYGKQALLHLRPRTGRTHQLRVHLAGLGCPILGDPIYGPRRAGRGGAEGPGLMLHAWRLAIRLPGPDIRGPGALDAQGRSLFVAPLPERFKRLLAALEGRYGKERPPKA